MSDNAYSRGVYKNGVNFPNHGIADGPVEDEGLKVRRAVERAADDLLAGHVPESEHENTNEKSIHVKSISAYT